MKTLLVLFVCVLIFSTGASADWGNAPGTPYRFNNSPTDYSGAHIQGERRRHQQELRNQEYSHLIEMNQRERHHQQEMQQLRRQNNNIPDFYYYDDY